MTTTAKSSFESTPQRLRTTAAELGESPAYFVLTEDGWKATSWIEFSEQVNQAARALLALGVEAGQIVCIQAFNRPEWSIMDIAAMSIGAAPAGIYWTCAPAEVEYILNDSKAPIVLVENQAQFDKVQRQRSQLPYLRHIVAMDGSTIDGAIAWQDFLALGNNSYQNILTQRLAAITTDTIGCLIYTSGTTGPAKAVMLNHYTLTWTRQQLSKYYQTGPDDRLLSYLPMAHIAEQIGAVHNHVESGFSLYYARSIESMADHLKEIRPTIYFGVPRVWEKIRIAIEEKLSKATFIKRMLARWAFAVGRRWHLAAIEGRSISYLLKQQKKLAHRLVHDRLKQALGLDQARLLMTGAAPTSIEDLHFFAGLDLLICEVYGQSESCGPISLNTPACTRFGSVGKPMNDVMLRIIDDEIQIRGGNVFSGYLNRPAETSEAFDDGWLRTGDLGYIDDDGFLYITGRKKDLIITSGGKNISPINLETELAQIPLVEHAVVYGDLRHFLIALLTLNIAELERFAAANQIAINAVKTDPRLLESLQRSIDEVNSQHARVENIRKFILLAQPLSIDNGELTPTLKVRRQMVIARNKVLIDQLYRQGKS